MSGFLQNVSGKYVPTVSERMFYHVKYPIEYLMLEATLSTEMTKSHYPEFCCRNNLKMAFELELEHLKIASYMALLVVGMG